MKILLAQINPIAGDINGNTDKLISTVKKFKADILVFPELSISGYIPNDLLLKKSFLDDNMKALMKIISECSNKTAIVGFAEKSGNKVYNSAAVIHNKALLGIYRKQRLPNYSIFDEKRWFCSQEYPRIFDLVGKRIGINICEDIWFEEPTVFQVREGCEIIINISASPYSEGKIEKIESVIMQRHKENNKIPIIYVNQVGAQDGIIFYGHSMLVKGGKIISCRDFEEDFFVVNV